MSVGWRPILGGTTSGFLLPLFVALACVPVWANATQIQRAQPSQVSSTSFWHYAIGAEDGQSTELVWSALGDGGKLQGTTSDYVVQCWPTAAIPEPGQDGYLASLLSLVGQEDSIARSTFRATHEHRSSGAATASYYRILAMAADGSVAASTQPLQPAAHVAGSVFVSQRPCGGGPCRRLLQAPTIQAAIDAAAPGATVNVLPDGSPYTGPGNTNLSFRGKNITLFGLAGPQATVIDCQGSASCRAFAFTAADSPGAQVSGFTLTNGTAIPGGCTAVADSSPTFSNCFFSNCGSRDPSRPGNGGAVSVTGASAAPRFLGCRFSDNYANFGGGIHVAEGSLQVDSCEFVRNDGAPGVGQGGALYFLNSQPSLVRDTVITQGSVGFSGGALSAQLAAEVRLERVRVTDNKSGTFAGAILVWGSNLTIADSELANNSAVVYGGAVLVQYGQYNATSTRHVNNTAEWGGGGAISLFSGVALLRGCELSGNRASFGGGLNAMRMKESTIAVPTIVSVNDTVVDGNVATDHGAAFNIESADLAVLVNVSITNNVAASRGGGGWCQSEVPLQLYGCLVQNNTAATGGGFFAQGPCPLLVVGSEFKQNSASGHGAGIAIGDGASLNASQSSFTSNGAAACSSSRPQGGGAIFVGVEPFQGRTDQCVAHDAEASLATVDLDTVRFSGNRASEGGGAVQVVAGTLTMNTVELTNNAVLGPAGVGGAISLEERCNSEGACSPITALLTGLNATGNRAQTAGGALFFSGSNPGSGLMLSNSRVAKNRVMADLQGLGGGLYLGHPNFTVSASELVSNSAFYGGGVFLAANLSQGASLAYLSLTGNTAAGMGAAAYWLRSKSPAAALTCDACIVSPSGPKSPYATEALQMQYGTEGPPTLVQSSRDAPAFQVTLLDYYGSVSTTSKGACIASVNSTTAVLSSKGSEEMVQQGAASFDSLQLRGTINQSYELQLDFEGVSGVSNSLLTAMPVPPLPLPLIIAPCAPGSQPNSALDDCIECSDGTYNLDGGECLPCPDGALCNSGSEIRALANYWRSSNQSAEFYACMVSGACLAGSAAGDASCDAGQQGPLCDVCQSNFFKLSGSCESCKGGQSKAMLAVTVIVLVLLALALFSRDWTFGAHGPGIMTKIKILLTHFQMLALFRDYDVFWPSATSSAMGWFEVVNIGFSMLAPECFFGNGSFYVVYIAQMVLPFACVGTCVALYYGAELALRRMDPSGERRAAGAAASGLVGWLEGLKIRCWKNAFWFVTLLYPRCAMTALQLFGWKTLDVGTFLKADFSIMVKYPGGGFVGTYVKYMIPGCLMLILYALVIPGFWFAAVYLNRKRLDDPVTQAKYGFLYASYAPHLPYWETTEMLRKFAIAFMPVFIPAQANGSLQAAAAQIVLLLYIMLTLRCWPFAKGADNWLQLASLTVLWLLLLSAGVSKWADLSSGGSKALSVVQLVLSSGVGFLLGAAVFFNGLQLAKQFSKSWSKKRKAKQQARLSLPAVEAVSGSGSGGGEGTGGGAGGAQGMQAGSQAGDACSSSGTTGGGKLRISGTLGCLPCAGGSKRGSLVDLEDGEIHAAHDEAAALNKAGSSSRPSLPAQPAQPVINVHAGAPPLPGEGVEGTRPGGDETPQSRRKLLRTSSMSRRSAADDVEMRLPKEGVQRSDSSTLPWPPLALHGDTAALPSPRWAGANLHARAPIPPPAAFAAPAMASQPPACPAPALRQVQPEQALLPVQQQQQPAGAVPAPAGPAITLESLRRRRSTQDGS